MKVAASLFLTASLSVGALAQGSDEKGGPGLEILKLEVSMVKVRDLGEPMPLPPPRPESGPTQRQSDSGTPQERWRTVGPSTTPRPPQRAPSGTRSSNSRSLDTTGARGRGGYIYYASLSVSNSGTKKIRLIAWDYVIVDPESRQELRRTSFRTKKKIEPGQKAVLTEEVKPSTGDRVAEIVRVEYSDGSTWIRPVVAK